MTRPRTRLDRKLILRIADYRAEGMTLEASAALAGVPKQTLHRWLKRVDEDNLCGELGRALALAESRLQQRCLSVIRQAAAAAARAAEEGRPVQWQPAAWLLERVFPDAYSLRASHVVEHKHSTREAVAEMRAQVGTQGEAALGRLAAPIGVA